MNESESQNTWTTISSKKKNTKVKISYNGTSYGSNKKPKFEFDVKKTNSNKKVNIDEFPSFQKPNMKVQFKLDDQKKATTSWSSIVKQEKKPETKPEKKPETKPEKKPEKIQEKKPEKMKVRFVFEEKKVEEKIQNTWSSIVKQEKIQEKKPEKKSEKKQEKMKVRFVFEEKQVEKQVEQKIENTWSSIVKQENKPEKKSNEPKIYMLEEDVDILVKLMNWGDFEVFMDDVITIPYGEKSKNVKRLTEEEINQIVKENS